MANVSWISPDYPVETYDGPPRNIACIDQLKFDPSLQPVSYEIAGTDPTAKILILDVDILEATGREPYRGDVLITGRPHDVNSLVETPALGLLLLCEDGTRASIAVSPSFPTTPSVFCFPFLRLSE